MELDFRTPITFGWGTFKELRRIVPKGKVHLILGRNSARSLDLENRIKDNLGRDVTTFSGVEPNPLETTIIEGARSIKEAEPDTVIALGGGSVMDAAKFMAVMARYGGNVMDYIERRIVPEGPGYPVIAVPTTPGTSSEITPFSIVTVPDKNNKLGLRHPSIYPVKAVIDPKLTVSLPKDQTASTGFDILSHAVESFWSRNANPMSQEMCLSAIRLIGKHLKGAYEDGTSKQHREGVSLASIFAGLSFSNTGTTICHAISYPITVDTGLPHGMACALSLGPTFELLANKEVPRMDELARAFGSEKDSFKEDLIGFMKDLDVPTDLKEIGFHGGTERIMSTDIKGFQRNFTVRINEDDVREIINGM